MAAPAPPQPAPSTPFASASLYVGDLLPDVSEALLYDVFNAVGPVASVRVCRDAATRRSLGYAYVNFHRVEDAERALDTMNFKNIHQHPCRIMWSHRDPSLRKSGLGNIFVKGLDATIDNKQLYDTFSMFGNILSCKVAYNELTKRSLGYGFVHYETEQAALDAIEKVNEKVISGKQVSVSPFKPRKDRGFTNVYVKNFPSGWDEQRVLEEFRVYGTIASHYFPKDDQEKSRGFGFVAFERVEDAVSAVGALNGRENEAGAGGPALYVARAQKKEERQRHLRDRFEQLKLDRQRRFAGVNLYVKNLSDGTDDDKLSREFAPFGIITSARVMKDPSGKSKGFGFVCFSLPEEAAKATAELNGRLLDNKPLYVAPAQRKDIRRTQLEAMQQQRAKLGQQQALYGQGGPVFYQQRNFSYPQAGQQGPPRWGPGQVLRHPSMQQYQLVQAPPQQRPVAPFTGLRAGGGGGGGRPRPAAAQVKYADNARNTPPQPQQVAGGLTLQDLAAAPEAQRKQMIGEKLFVLVRQRQPDLAGKITGMLLEMELGELLNLLEDATALTSKIDEAIAVLNEHQQQA